jgi:DNA-binding transcriptional MocR family regulator
MLILDAGAFVAAERGNDDVAAWRAGLLLARTGTADAIDASVICLAQDGDDVLTSDPADLRALASAARVHVDLISV